MPEKAVPAHHTPSQGVRNACQSHVRSPLRQRDPGKATPLAPPQVSLNSNVTVREANSRLRFCSSFEKRSSRIPV